jgi:tetratricopeptide (TPR) repeat protein
LLKPDATFTLSGLGYAYLQSGKEDDAVRTFAQGLRVNPREDYFYRALANICLQRRQGQSAVNYATGYLSLKGWREDYSAYMALAKYFGLRQAERSVDAARMLDEASDKLDNTAGLTR